MFAFKKWLTGGADEPTPEVAPKESPPQTTSWWRRKLSGTSSGKETGDDIPLELIINMQSVDAAIEAIQGRWLTGAGTEVTIKGHTLSTSESETNTLSVSTLGKKTTICMSECEIVLSSSTSRKLTWSDSDTWTRPGTTQSECDRTSQWVGKNTQSKPPPSSLLVISPERPELEGRYTLSNPSEFINNNPVWELKRIRLYTDPLGYWMFATAMKMSQNLGIMSSNEPHKGVLPDAIESWEYFAGKQYGSVDGWTTATLTTITNLDKQEDGVQSVPQPCERPRPVSGALRRVEDVVENSENCVRFRLSIFFAEYDPSVLIHPQFINSFVHRIMTPPKSKNGSKPQPTTLQNVMTSLCRKYQSATVADWSGTGYDCMAVSKYILEGFYAKHAPKHGGKVDGLLEGLQLGRFTLQDVLVKLCAAFEGNYENWCSGFPAAFRKGYSIAGQLNPDKDSDDGPEIIEPRLSKIILTRATNNDPVSLDYSDQTMLCGVLPHGLGDRNNMQRFIGARLHSINGKRIRTWTEYLEATNDATTLAFEFFPKVADDRGHDIKPVLLIDLPQIQSPKASSKTRDSAAASEQASSPSVRRARVTESPTIHLEKAETLHREKVETDQFDSLTSYLLPRRAALAVVEVEAFYRSYVDARTALWKSSETGKPPLPKLITDLKSSQTALAKSTLIADKASTLCKVPDGIVDVIYKTKGSLASSVQNAQIGDKLEKEFLESEEEYTALSKEIKATVELVSADPDEKELKAKLTSLNEKMVEVDQDNAKKYTALIKAAGSHPHLAWRSVLHKKQIKAEKKKAKKNKAKAKEAEQENKKSQKDSPKSEDKSPKAKRSTALPFGEEKDDAGSPPHSPVDDSKKSQKAEASAPSKKSNDEESNRAVALPFGEKEDAKGTPVEPTKKNKKSPKSKKDVALPFGEEKDDTGSRRAVALPFGEGNTSGSAEAEAPAEKSNKKQKKTDDEKDSSERPAVGSDAATEKVEDQQKSKPKRALPFGSESEKAESMEKSQRQKHDTECPY